MAGIACDQCGAKLRVTVTGGMFYVREGSELKNINFEKADDTVLITLEDTPDEEVQVDAETTLTVDVCCSVDPDHMLFSHVESEVKRNIFGRIKQAAAALERKYHSA